MAAVTELSALIAKTVEEQTFSLDAVKAIGAIRDRAIVLEKQLVDADKMIADRDATIAKQREQIATDANSRAALIERESALAKREANTTALEKNAAVADAKAQILDSMFSRMFANRITRENVIGNSVHQMPGQYPVTMPDNKTIERTEG